MPERIGNTISFHLYYNEAVITQILGAVKKKNACRLHLLRLHITYLSVPSSYFCEGSNLH